MINIYDICIDIFANSLHTSSSLHAKFDYMHCNHSKTKGILNIRIMVKYNRFKQDIHVNPYAYIMLYGLCYILCYIWCVIISLDFRINIDIYINSWGHTPRCSQNTKHPTSLQYCNVCKLPPIIISGLLKSNTSNEEIVLIPHKFLDCDIQLYKTLNKSAASSFIVQIQDRNGRQSPA